MGFRDQVRIFSLRYRRSSHNIHRDEECHCKMESSGEHKVGSVWHDERDGYIWVHVAVAAFDTPTTESAGNHVDALFNRSELAAEQWIQAQFPELPLR